jgi:TFIIF-interacting CTD phosphatase-like protein
MSYDASTYVKLIGLQTFKIYITYRTYLIQMLTELKQDFEIILFSCKNSQKYVQRVAEAVEKGNDKYFDHLMCVEDMFYFADIDFNILDLNVLLGPLTTHNTSSQGVQGGQRPSRDLKDIIVVANTCGAYMFHINNGIPLKEFYGSKHDLSLFSLTRYLKTFKDVKDVRTKIKEDFNL